jgi:hypothetical protein
MTAIVMTREQARVLSALSCRCNNIRLRQRLDEILLRVSSHLQGEEN